MFKKESPLKKAELSLGGDNLIIFCFLFLTKNPINPKTQKNKIDAKKYVCFHVPSKAFGEVRK